MPDCFLPATSQPHFLIRSQAEGSQKGGGEGDVMHLKESTPPPAILLTRSCPDVNLIGSVRPRQRRSGTLLPDLPISSRRNSTNESLWGTDAARSAWTKTTCHTHLMITHTNTIMSRSALAGAPFARLYIRESHHVGFCESLYRVCGRIPKRCLLIHNVSCCSL